MPIKNEHWPALSLEQWQETYETLHLWSQIVGKIRLSQTQWVNHSWHTTLYLNASGLTTSLMPYGNRGFEIEFDFVDHRLRITTTEGERRSFSLKPMSVASFYQKIFQALAELDIKVSIMPKPVELPDPIQPFSEDFKHASYDRESVEKYWRVIQQVHRVFTNFRARFVGKVSPVHFFWGAFDLAVTRFSGRPAPKHPGGAPNCADWVMEEAYSHELSSAGFWPGAGLGEAAFYAYAYPEPKGFREYPIKPKTAYYHKNLGEFVLPYEEVRKADDPDAVLLDFLQTTFDAAANLADWDCHELERQTDPTPQ